MRRIKKAQITFISLVPAGANQLNTIYKAEDNSLSFGTLIKASDNFDEQGELLSVVYAPELRDSQGDIASAEVVKQMAHDFIANGGKVDIRHNGVAVPPEQARVGETFIVQKSDERFHGWKDRTGKAVDLTASWATVIKIDDPELRKKYRSGEWAGVSMGGTAIVEQEKADVTDLLSALTKALSTHNSPAHTSTNSENDTMTPEQFAELKKALTDGFGTMTAELKKAITPETPKLVQKQDGPPVLPDAAWSNARLVKQHLRNLQIYSLKEATIKVDASLAKEFQQGMIDLRKEWAEEDAVEQAATAGPAGGTHTTTRTAPTQQHLGGQEISKMEQDLVAAGKLAAEQVNKQNQKLAVA